MDSQSQHTVPSLQTRSRDLSDSAKSSVTLQLAWQDVEDRGNCETSEDVVRNYAKTADRYEEVVQLLGYPAPVMIAEAVQKLLKDKHDAKILDMGAGTGLVAVELAKRGYTNVDALDASTAMLKIAAEKNVYKKVILHFVGSTPIPLEDNSYDMIVACGAFGCNFIPVGGIDEALRLVRPGGYIVNVTRIHELQKDWLAEFDAHLKRLEEEKKWRQVSKTRISGYVGDYDGDFYIHTVL